MSKFDSLSQTKFSNLTFRIEVPEGAMFVAVIEDTKGKPIAVDVVIGKAGSTIRAWATSISKIMTVSLEHGATIDHFIKELHSQHADKVVQNGEQVVRSGPEGICVAFIKYRLDRFQRAKKSA